MCGISFAFSKNKKKLGQIESKLADVKKSIRYRGPDRLTEMKGDNYIAIHAHLVITGFRKQPIITEDFLLSYNGEIYNEYEKYCISETLSDADYLVHQIIDKGVDAFKYLDGEFAAYVYMFKTETLLLASDTFGTKPLYYQLGDDYCLVGTYDNTVSLYGMKGDIVQVPANTCIEIDLNTFLIKSIKQLRRFDFSNQTLGTFERWNAAFRKSVLKRVANEHHNYFVSFSSGHDSGLIVAELLQNKKPFGVYYSMYGEIEDVLSKRLDLLKAKGISYSRIDPLKEEYIAMRDYLHKYLAPYQLIISDCPSCQEFADSDMRNLPGYVVSAVIHKRARDDNRLISLTGQGADEIISDYYNEKTNSRKSNLKGQWEKATNPWSNFFGGWNKVFIGASERIAGLFGIETRYPFLDFDVVQEFLNLHPKVKGSLYKAPVTNRLQEYHFPFHMGKQGFAGFKE